MAMVTKNNIAAQLVLGQLNKNQSKLEKELAKVSSGQKITGAKDDSAMYAISEKMREQIRSMEQDTQNVQNGSSLFKIADGGISNIVEELRNLKELAINAANDTNTDQDRATIQKEFSHKMANINDIATTTNYNGKTLLDGTYSLMVSTGQDLVGIPEIVGYTERKVTYTKNSVTRNRQVDGNIAIRENNNNPDIAKNFFAIDSKVSTYTSGRYLRSGRGVEGDIAFSGNSYGGWSYAKATMDASDYSTAVTVASAFSGGGVSDSSKFVNWLSFYPNRLDSIMGDISDTRGQIGVSMNFTFSSNNPTISELDGEGFSILCGACNQYINIVFDASKNNADSEYTLSNNDVYRCSYVIGVQDLTTVDNDTLSEAIFKGVQAAHTNNTGSIHYYDDVSYTYDAEGAATDTKVVSTNLDAYHFVSVSLNPQYDSNDSSKGSKYIFTKTASPNMIFLSEGVLVGVNDENALPKGVNEQTQFLTSTFTETIREPIYQYHYEMRDSYAPEGVPLKIHHGTKANQAIAFFINDMHTKSLGKDDLFIDDKTLPEEERFLKSEDRDRYWALSYDTKKQADFLETVRLASGKTLDYASVTTQKNANVAVKIVENAIDYALNEATRVGSYLQRLDYTGTNIVTMSENIQSAESVIRDADMAKEMTEYTKSNVLTQAAQSMLAQANQSSSAVLSLLQ